MCHKSGSLLPYHLAYCGCTLRGSQQWKVQFDLELSGHSNPGSAWVGAELVGASEVDVWWAKRCGSLLI